MAIHPGKKRSQLPSEVEAISSQVSNWVLQNFELTEAEAIAVTKQALELCPCPPISGELSENYIDRASRNVIRYIDNNPDNFGDDQGNVEVGNDRLPMVCPYCNYSFSIEADSIYLDEAIEASCPNCQKTYTE